VCASNRTLLAGAHHGRTGTAVLASPTEPVPLGTAADWSAASCC
jgi:hypothetical protein